MGLFGTTKRTMVVSVDAILKNNGARGAAAPRQQLQVLRSLSRVVQREKLNVTAVIAGNPLHKAPHNQVFDGVRVRYAASDETVGKELIKSLRQAGSAGVLVTEDIDLEKKVLAQGADTLRTSTFRKLLDENGSENSGENRDRSGGARKKNRRDREPRAEYKKQRRPKEDKPVKEQQDEISQMIDLVE